MDFRTGANIKWIRERSSISLPALAAALRLDQAYLERIEGEEVEPPVFLLLRIANALNTDIAELMCGFQCRTRGAVVTKAASRSGVTRKGHLHYESLAPFYSGRHMEPFIVTIHPSPSGPGEISQHKGDEFHYVLDGVAQIRVGRDEFVLETGDSIYFDSSTEHTVHSARGNAKLISVIYNGESMIQLTRSRHMRDIVHAAKLLGGTSVAVVCPDTTCMEALSTAIKEGVVTKAFLVGDTSDLDPELLDCPHSYEPVPLDRADPEYFVKAARAGVELVRDGRCHMLMKGQVNTAVFVKAVLHKETGITTGRRLSLVSLFELPDINRLVFLTDPGINTELVSGADLQSSIDIIRNAIDVARGLGVSRPKVALLDANEVPSANMPTTIYEKQLSEMSWDDADVYGPLSYDLALYEESRIKKGFRDSTVAGKADVLVVPFISGGNFLYKAWALTTHAEVASVVVGAKAPIIMTSRNDSEMTKFLTLCASAVYGQYLRGRAG